jgi:hypothetical protein
MGQAFGKRLDDSTEAAWWFEADETTQFGGQLFRPASLGDDEEVTDLRASVVPLWADATRERLAGCGAGWTGSFKGRRQIDPNVSFRQGCPICNKGGARRQAQC